MILIQQYCITNDIALTLLHSPSPGRGYYNQCINTSAVGLYIDIAMLQGERINPEQNALPSDIYRPRPPDYGGSFLGYL